eukprot:CAMPEP_0171650092 /NCGR_PEP_ID=MMETSP0990-20121206/37327_1 /TAXON_ID=483369 /ORGANISM="non described non described, Strain CCMP2098" /LENGTH=32 /DNA_ID= /DNA_START= /DNA_END= /DNA_ORIENTATION=
MTSRFRHFNPKLMVKKVAAHFSMLVFTSAGAA